MIWQHVVSGSGSAAQPPSMEAAHPVAPLPSHWPTVPGVGGGVLLLVLGTALLFKTRTRARSATISKEISLVTRYIGACALLILGYHLCAWSLPETMIPLHAPVQRWYVVLLLALGAVSASWAVDRIESRLEQDPAAR